MTCLLIGDKPSAKNLDPKIAFIGTQSHRTLLSWCYIIGITEPYFANRVDTDLPKKLAYCAASNVPVIALGKASQKHLKDLELNHYCLPHPSGRNRALNDKFALELQLEYCRKWVQNVKPWLK